MNTSARSHVPARLASGGGITGGIVDAERLLLPIGVKEAKGRKGRAELLSAVLSWPCTALQARNICCWTCAICDALSR